ncbi:MAG: carboxypeptidase-like regulatory domain-containing protein [Chitinophagaceae bacterium]|nr:carboxypeptidase-like regulatory domain-containing protein [Chitinophagaceae bacterium]
MKNFVLALTVFLFSTSAFSQNEREGEQMPANEAQVKLGGNRLFGKLVNETTGKGVEAASVQLFVADSLIRGMLSKPNGDFNFENLPANTSFTLQISAIGFEPYIQNINADQIETLQGGFTKDLGNIMLNAEVKQLGGVVVSSSRPSLELGIDRKVFNAAKKLYSYRRLCR